MGLMQKVYKELFNKQRVLFSLILILYVILHAPIEAFFSNTIVKYLLSYIQSVWYNDIIFLSIPILMLFFVIVKFRKYTQSINLFFFLLLLTIIYLLYRINGNVWKFTPFSFSEKIKYADVIGVIFILTLFLLIKNKPTSKKNGTDTFFDDIPIEIKENDVLGYSSYAELLADKIKSSHFDKAFAIGINGKWGLGKTSFINLLKTRIKGDDIIEVNFNPWKSNSPKAIIQDFFETIQESIRPYHSSLAKLLITYSNKLVSLNENKITQSIQNSVSALTGFESLESLFDGIDKSLKRIDKKIIIYIDDVDRLDKEEIVEVLRLVRNTANFYNTFFIVAYDRNYIISALKNHNLYRQEEFLEKIFQLEITLPYFKKDIFRQELAKKLKTKLEPSLHEEIENVIIGSGSIITPFLDSWLDTMRDVTRLANALVLNFGKLKEEVDFNDFVRLEVLRLKYPYVYELLFRRTVEFLTINDGKTEKLKYILKETTISPGKVEKQLKIFLDANYQEFFIPKGDIDKIVNYIDNIFENRLVYSHYNSKYLSVAYPSKFYRYFAYNLPEGSLSEVEFSKARELSSEEFNKKIAEWVKKNLEYEIKNKFEEIKTFDNREDFEKVIVAIFYLANLSKGSQNSLIFYKGSDLYDKLDNYDNKIVKRYYSNQNGKEEYKNFLLSIFNNANSPFLFEASFIRFINSQHLSEDFPITRDELKEIVINYFKTYCDSSINLDSNLWSLFHDCKITEWIEINPGSRSYQSREVLPKETRDIMITFILEKDLDGFLLTMIDIALHDEGKYAISNFVIGLFSDWQSFKKILENQDDKKWKYLKEFKQLLYEFEKTNYSQYVSFNFNKIDISEKNKKR